MGWCNSCGTPSWRSPRASRFLLRKAPLRRLFQFHSVQGLIAWLQSSAPWFIPIDLENVGDDVRVGIGSQ